MKESAPAPYRLGPSGVYLPGVPVRHRDDEYDAEGFAGLREMQTAHFWYRGRHRFLYHAVRRELRRRAAAGLARPDAVDLGGGCGGWLRYLADRGRECFGELALADSSLRALELAGPVLPPGTARYQADLLDLGWRGRWDMAFLLDVLEHIPDDEAALRQARASLRPGGVLLVATPALRAFWSYNDDLAHHVRRYCKADFRALAARCGFRLRHCHYFMFFLSPLYFLSRRNAPDLARMTSDEVWEHLRRSHRTPAAPVNTLLSWVFGAETPLGHLVPFPWGTSILGVFERA